MTAREFPSRHRIPAAALLPILLGLLVGLLPSAFSEAQTGNKRLPLITVQPKSGEPVTLRDAQFGVTGRGERPQGSAPPGAPVGPLPGNTPGVGGFGGPGDGGGTTKRDPRQPTHNLSGTPRNPGSFLGSGLTVRDLFLLRRLHIVDPPGGEATPDGITYGDFYYKNGELELNVPMRWTHVSGWERPGQQGKFFYFEAEDILYLEFPRY